MTEILIKGFHFIIPHQYTMYCILLITVGNCETVRKEIFILINIVSLYFRIKFRNEGSKVWKIRPVLLLQWWLSYSYHKHQVYKSNLLLQWWLSCSYNKHQVYKSDLLLQWWLSYSYNKHQVYTIHLTVLLLQRRLHLYNKHQLHLTVLLLQRWLHLYNKHQVHLTVLLLKRWLPHGYCKH